MPLNGHDYIFVFNVIYLLNRTINSKIKYVKTEFNIKKKVYY
jgi:hypothetical protein